ncbi:amidase [Paraliobacillus sediminis]|uniref:amidase n=1 Tax=Paraliobacillus sediminis TaxID=1885916 RepID=UPI000E3C9191|nr:amidase [Paraliobacillus sediminis]
MDIKTYQDNDAIGLAELVKSKQVSQKELLDAAFLRLEEVNPDINAVIRTRKEKVYQEARNEKGQDQPFFGVPMVLKDISQAIKGEVLSSGSKLLQNNIAKTDSNLVAKLREAGFLFLGHTNTPEFGLKNITEPETYGVTRNPWKLGHSSGGSSGGSAAAVASGIVPVAGASDGGGSIRIPASFTGLFGLKPTRGRTPVGPGVGRQWQGASIDFALTRSVRDSAALLDLLQTIQPEAAFQTPLYEGSYLDLVHKSTDQKYRIAFTTASPVGTPVSEDAKKAVHKVVKWLEEEGHHVEELESPVDGTALMKNYYVMNSGEMNRVITNLEKMLGREITLADTEIVTWVLHKAGEKVSAAAYSESLAGWDIAAAQMARFHQKYDFYVTPTNAHPAPENGELTHIQPQIEKLKQVDQLTRVEQQKRVYEMFLPSLTYTPHTQLANLTGQPAMSVPTFLTKSGLPMGVQFIAAKGREDKLLAIASQLEQSDLWINKQAFPFS